MADIVKTIWQQIGGGIDLWDQYFLFVFTLFDQKHVTLRRGGLKNYYTRGSVATIMNIFRFFQRLLVLKDIEESDFAFGLAKKSNLNSMEDKQTFMRVKYIGLVSVRILARKSTEKEMDLRVQFWYIGNLENITFLLFRLRRRSMWGRGIYPFITAEGKRRRFCLKLEC